MQNNNWYYTTDGNQHGPIGATELQNKIASNQVPADTLVWQEGMTDWTKANTIPALSTAATPSFNPTPSLTNPTPQPQSAQPGAMNPYATIQTNVLPTNTGEAFPFPYVKRANYPLFLGLNIIGLVIAIIGGIMLITSMESTGAFVENSQGYETYQSTSGPPSATSVIITLVGSAIFIWGAILGLIYIHRAWTAIQPGHPSTTPGKAVGFLFIPLFNIYWAFIAYWKWAQDWNRIRQTYPSLQTAPAGSEGVFLGACICQCAALIVGGLASFPRMILHFIGMKSMCDVINYANENSQQPKP